MRGFLAIKEADAAAQSRAQQDHLVTPKPIVFWDQIKIPAPRTPKAPCRFSGFPGCLAPKQSQQPDVATRTNSQIMANPTIF